MLSLGLETFQQMYWKMASENCQGNYAWSRKKAGKTINYYYSVPDDPKEHMLSYIYSRKHMMQYYPIADKLPPILKMFCWGEWDFVANPDYDSEMAFEYCHGRLKFSEDDFKKIHNSKDIPIKLSELQKKLIFGSTENFASRLSEAREPGWIEAE